MLPEFTAPNVHATAISFLDGLGGRLLDLGCGTGSLSEKIISKYPGKFDVTGADFNREAYKLEGGKFVQADLNRPPLPFPDASFDVVMLVEVIEHVDNPASLLSEIRRVLSPGGTLILSTPNVENWQSRIYFALTGRFFSFLPSDMPSNNPPGMGHVNPMFDFQLKTLIAGKFELQAMKYNRVRLPKLAAAIPTGVRLLGEVKVIKLKRL
ncbi:MAG: class I SAM-dependent methyltransferase [Candidatus Micrarchaeia archaeon]